MAGEEEVKESKGTTEFYARFALLVMCVAAVFMLIAASIWLAWNPFAFDMHLSQLTYPGALGLTGLILIAISLIEATILVAHKDWGD